MTIRITEAEILEALRQASAPSAEDDPGLTRDELAERMGMCPNQISKKVLKPLAKQGKLIVGRRRSYRSDGVPCLLPVYRVA